MRTSGRDTEQPIAIRVSGLSKAFRVWQRPADMLLEALSLGRRHTDLQALKAISFEVRRGSVTGIMGRNGAGKSTLLRIVAGTLDATGGSMEVNGRISAILELGTGFSPEYTGRDNIYLGGMCLGLKRHEIKDRFNEIVAFSELAEFIDMPFRTFSSGMQARLTFAVATSVDPDILIIDEALAVGDARFQVKSFDRVREFKRRGKAILLVSHDMNQIASICDHAILLEKGRIVADGAPKEVCNIYHEMLFAPAVASMADETTRSSVSATDSGTVSEVGIKRDVAERAMSTLSADSVMMADAAPADASLIPQQTTSAFAPPLTAASKEHRYGDGMARIVSMGITTSDGRPVARLISLMDYRLVCRVRAMRDVPQLVFGWLLRDKRGLDLFGWDTQTAGLAPVDMKSGEEHDFVVGFSACLGPGRFFVTSAIAQTDGHKHDVRLDALEIAVEGALDLYTTSLVNLAPHMVS
ncbi:ABC transporter ATP-binding protein [Thiorhodovibrio frisius]|uniref:ABC-type polysaccharide/polyol phosphate transport system, ATPase component n=1 Tax=Thiorhodovibrio frisius TaxID=631362 RepID=H8Z1R4_9GAMM|nr:ABC transporter ATP-binding protein [Thiorhodovibrio frisius]EIC22542.1 ABC-type polysaccharide/polyol phosphate transport system, ATPase component [Thiorhodovibrio frisius]WPL19982.1 Teichoic acids export ATP-binding protein TagH [Thiorhodovibrio frisius]